MFCVLFMVTFPISFSLLPDVSGVIGQLFEPIIYWMASVLFGFEPGTFTVSLLSDTTGMYLLGLLWLTVSFLLSLLWQWKGRSKINYDKWVFWFLQLGRYYLVIHMIQYGLNKVFKFQFYFPEPNTLFTTIGSSSRDILFWSTIGSSYEYTVFSGVIEVCAALLLLFRKTRLLGAMLTMGVMVNVVMINFAFDISVKFLSSFLLLLGLLLIAPDGKRLFRFFFTSEIVKPGSLWLPKMVLNRSLFYRLLKTLIIALLIMDGLFPYVRSATFNDDNGVKPYLYGAYRVTSFEGQVPSWKRAFVHRDGYFIIQGQDELMTDYVLQIDTVINVISLFKNKNKVATLGYRDESTYLKLFGKFKGERIDLALDKIDLNSLPIHSKGFSWTIDSHLSPTK